MSAHRSPSALLELATGFQRSSILFALIELGIPTWLAERPSSASELAAQLDADPLAIGRFLDACVALGLLVRDADRFRNAPDTQAFLVRGAPTDLGEALTRYERVAHSSAWNRFPQRLLSWRSGGTRERLADEAMPVAKEQEAQHRLSLLAGEALAGALDLSSHRCLIDLGGGTGAMSIALCRHYPSLRAIVVELPPVAAAAAVQVRASGLADRIEVRAADFVECALPTGGDVVLLANVLSMLGTDTSRALLRRIFASLPADGRIVLSGWMLDDERTGSLLSVLLSLEDVVLNAPDVERTSAMYAEWLVEAGFTEVVQRRYFDPIDFVVGRKRPASGER